MARRRTFHPSRLQGRARALWTTLYALMVAHSASAVAQTSPAHGPLPTTPRQAAASGDDIPLADYLGLLRQIAPAAEDGARTYLAAARLRCGRELNTAELRLAMAQHGGDPVLMGLIRAAHAKDQAARQQLVAQVQCPAGGSR